MAVSLLIIDTVERSGAPSIIETVPSRPLVTHQLRLENYLVNTEPTGQKIEKSQWTSYICAIASADTK